MLNAVRAPLRRRWGVILLCAAALEFIVDSIEFIDKDSLPQEAPRIFTHRGPYRLVLITCGGAFDESIRSYESNVVIIALPAPAVSG